MRHAYTAAAAFAAFCLSASAGLAESSYTNEDVVRYFESNGRASKAHKIMSGQRKRLHGILEDILSGNLESVGPAAGEMADLMRPMMVETPLETEREAQIWKTISEVVLQAKLMQAAAERDDYKKTYEHFAVMTSQCVHCHQLARPWGKFQEPAPPDEPSGAGSGQN